MRRILIILALTLLAIFTLVIFALGLQRPARFIQNFEQAEYGRQHSFIEPTSVKDGLAVYAVGSGEPVLLFPYPHGHTTEPMAQSPLAEILVRMGRTVLTFDVPGAYRSTREPVGDMEEMIRSADETLERLNIQGPVDVVGHSMGGFAALAYAVERPDRTRRLVLANSVSGFPAAARCGFPGSAFGFLDADYWRVILWGMRVNGGRTDLATHKQLQNLMESAAYFDKSFFTPIPVEPDDRNQGVPIRMIWSGNMYRGLSYAARLREVKAPTLVLAGRHDPEAGLPCSEELMEGIQEARLYVFEKSGHAPFIEEAALFEETLYEFMKTAADD